jgi:hypothetical protein
MFYKPAASLIVLAVFVGLLFVPFEQLYGQIYIPTAAPFLEISPSPEANAQGSSSVARITDDPYAINFNPAHLGLTSNQPYAMVSFYPTKVQWLPAQELFNIKYHSYAMSGGMNLEEYLNFPLSVGIAYSRVYFDFGNFAYTIDSPTPLGYYHPEEHSDVLSLGLGVDVGVRVAIGISFRKIESNLYPSGARGEQGSGNGSAWTRDYGLLVDIPVIKLLDPEMLLMPGVAPMCHVSFGTALTNVGDKMVYIDESQADLFPRNISVGTSLEFGIKHIGAHANLFTFTWSRQADDQLIRSNSSGPYYQGLFGDLDPIENIVQGKWTSNVKISQGWQLNLCDILFVRGGSFKGGGYELISTSGFGISTSGIFKFLQVVHENNEVISYIVDHVVLQYDQSEYSTRESIHPLNGTDFSSLSLKVLY